MNTNHFFLTILLALGLNAPLMCMHSQQAGPAANLRTYRVHITHGNTPIARLTFPNTSAHQASLPTAIQASIDRVIQDDQARTGRNITRYSIHHEVLEQAPQPAPFANQIENTLAAIAENLRRIAAPQGQEERQETQNATLLPLATHSNHASDATSSSDATVEEL